MKKKKTTPGIDGSMVPALFEFAGIIYAITFTVADVIRRCPQGAAPGINI
jgi:hypothetical protein